MKQSALDRLSALKGKDRDTIVRSSALAEWEKTNLFQVHLGREGTALLTEVVLAKCGQSEVDYATPLVKKAVMIKSMECNGMSELGSQTGIVSPMRDLMIVVN